MANPATSSQAADGAQAKAPTSPPAPAEAEEAESSQCPICQFIEAGPCKEQHQAWTTCREAAKREGVDYVDACEQQFKTFLQCALDNSEYYDPFLSMLLGEEDKGETAPDDQSNGAQAAGQSRGKSEGPTTS